MKAADRLQRAALPGLSAVRAPEPLLRAIAQHAQAARPGTPHSPHLLEGAREWLLHGLARALVAGRRPELAPHLKPRTLGGVLPGGARVPGTSLELEPVQAAFINTQLAGWECGPAGCAGHPCQHLGALLAVADTQARRALMQGQPPLTCAVLQGALLTSHQIQQGLARLTPPLHPDPALLLCVAQTAVLTVLLGGSPPQAQHAVREALRQAGAISAMGGDAGPAQGSRAAQAASLAVHLAQQALDGDKSDPGEPVPGEILAQDPPGTEGDLFGVSGRVSGSIPAFAGLPLPEQPGGPGEAVLQLLKASEQTFRPAQLERIKALLGTPPAALDAQPVSLVMAHLVTHAVREASRQMTLLP